MGNPDQFPASLQFLRNAIDHSRSRSVTLIYTSLREHGIYRLIAALNHGILYEQNHYHIRHILENVQCETAVTQQGDGTNNETLPDHIIENILSYLESKDNFYHSNPGKCKNFTKKGKKHIERSVENSMIGDIIFLNEDVLVNGTNIMSNFPTTTILWKFTGNRTKRIDCRSMCCCTSQCL